MAKNHRHNRHEQNKYSDGKGKDKGKQKGLCAFCADCGAILSHNEAKFNGGVCDDCLMGDNQTEQP